MKWQNYIYRLLYLFNPEESWNSYSWNTDKKRIAESAKWFFWYFVSIGMATGVAILLD